MMFGRNKQSKQNKGEPPNRQNANAPKRRVIVPLCVSSYLSMMVAVSIVTNVL